MTYTYTRKSHPAQTIRYKLEHSSMRLVELSIALRNVSEETKELADIVQEYYRNRAAQKRVNDTSAVANVTIAPKKSNGRGGAYIAGKHDRQKEIDGEPDALRKLHQTIARWLLSAPHDDPEEIAPLIPAPVSMVRRVRVQLVDAGKLGPLHNPKTDPVVPDPQHQS